MTNDEFLTLDAYWCIEMRKHAGKTVLVTEGDDYSGSIGELLGFAGLYDNGAAVLVLKTSEKIICVSSDNIEYI